MNGNVVWYVLDTRHSDMMETVSRARLSTVEGVAFLQVSAGCAFKAEERFSGPPNPSFEYMDLILWSSAV